MLCVHPFIDKPYFVLQNTIPFSMNPLNHSTMTGKICPSSFLKMVWIRKLSRQNVQRSKIDYLNGNVIWLISVLDILKICIKKY